MQFFFSSYDAAQINEVQDDLFLCFCLQVKQIEKRDSVLTPKQQIERLLRPGSSYFNLNPFEVIFVVMEAFLFVHHDEKS